MRVSVDDKNLAPKIRRELRGGVKSVGIGAAGHLDVEGGDVFRKSQLACDGDGERRESERIRKSRRDDARNLAPFRGGAGRSRRSLAEGAARPVRNGRDFDAARLYHGTASTEPGAFSSSHLRQAEEISAADEPAGSEKGIFAYSSRSLRVRRESVAERTGT